MQSLRNSRPPGAPRRPFRRLLLALLFLLPQFGCSTMPGPPSIQPRLPDLPARLRAPLPPFPDLPTLPAKKAASD